MAITLICTLPVLLICWDRYFRCKRSCGRTAMILYKCTATLMCVVAALAGALHAGVNPLLSLPFWGAVFCMLGDWLLEIRFLAGMAAFGLGHLVLIGWICSLFAAAGGLPELSIVIWALAWVGSAWMFRGQLRALGKRRAAFLLYAAVLMAMAAMALTLPLRLGMQAWSVALGGVLFAASDLLVAKGFFGKLSRAMDRFALLIYYAAVYLLAMGAWLL